MNQSTSLVQQNNQEEVSLSNSIINRLVKLKAQKKLKILYALTDMYALCDVENNIPSFYKNAFAQAIISLLHSISPADIHQLLSVTHTTRHFKHIASRLMRLAQPPREDVPFDQLEHCEKLFLAMQQHAQTLVATFSYVSDIHGRALLAQLLLNWVRQIPMTTSSQKSMLNALRGLTSTWLITDDPLVLRDWLILLKGSSDLTLMRDLSQQYLAYVYRHKTVATLRDAIQVLDDIIPPPDIIQLKRDFLRAVTQDTLLKDRSNHAQTFLLNVIHEFYENQYIGFDQIISDLIINLDTALQALSDARTTAIGTKTFADLGNQEKQLRAMQQTITALTKKQNVWQRLKQITYTIGRTMISWFASPNNETPYAPDFSAWEPRHIEQYFLGLTSDQYQGRITSMITVLTMMHRLANAIRWYEGFPEAQVFLKKFAQRYYTSSTFYFVHHKRYLDQFIFHCGLDQEMQDAFMPYLYELMEQEADEDAPYDERYQHPAYILEQELINNAVQYVRVRDYEYLKNLAPCVLEHFLKTHHISTLEPLFTAKIIEHMPHEHFAVFTQSLSKLFKKQIMLCLLPKMLEICRQISPQRSELLLRMLAESKNTVKYI